MNSFSGRLLGDTGLTALFQQGCFDCLFTLPWWYFTITNGLMAPRYLLLAFKFMHQLPTQAESATATQHHAPTIILIGTFSPSLFPRL